uniref:Protein FRA10AC1-like n=2 Tax=Hirondellea gigas TaxID=1518452 RepID=A0A2P2IB69_9CRUS
MSFKRAQDDYDSSFEGDGFVPKRARGGGGSGGGRAYRDPILQPHYSAPRNNGLPSRAALNDLSCVTIGQTLRYHQSSLTAYDRHKMLVNQYLLYHPQSTAFLARDSSQDRRDMDVVRENHQFLWDAKEEPSTWEKALAKKYYNKLFKEYCICDLDRYKENKIGMRWRIEKEVHSGKGQFSCGNKKCDSDAELQSWEMNFAYVEQAEKKNALVKLRLCEPCSCKLNFCRKRKKVKKRRQPQSGRQSTEAGTREETPSNSATFADGGSSSKAGQPSAAGGSGADDAESTTNIWLGPAKLPHEENKEDEFEQYLEDLLL